MIKENKKLKIVTLFLAILICLSGCGKKDDTANSNTTIQSESNMQDQPKEYKIEDMKNHGNITAIDLDNNTITVSSMFGFMKSPDNEKKLEERPDEPNRDEMSENVEPPKMPENFEPANKPEDMPQFDPNNAPEAMEDINPNDIPESSEQTYNIKDTTSIKDKDGNVITINELNIDDFIEYEIDGEDFTSISVIDLQEVPQNIELENNQKS